MLASSRVINFLRLLVLVCNTMPRKADRREHSIFSAPKLLFGVFSAREAARRCLAIRMRPVAVYSASENQYPDVESLSQRAIVNCQVIQCVCLVCRRNVKRVINFIGEQRTATHSLLLRRPIYVEEALVWMGLCGGAHTQTRCTYCGARKIVELSSLEQALKVPDKI